MKTYTALYSGPAKFNHDQLFFQSSLDGENTGWYVSVSEKRCYGPFREKEVAIYILNGLKKRLQETRQRNNISNIHIKMIQNDETNMATAVKTA